MSQSEFRSSLGQTTFERKYQLYPGETWAQRAKTIVETVCGPHLSVGDRGDLVDMIRTFKFMPGGRYIYYAGREAKFWNNCYLLKGEEDTREEWARLMGASASCLMTGGGIGIDYSVFRPEGASLGRTGGVASGPIPLMEAINEIGRRVQQGGSRRSAMYASLNWQHGDIQKFLTAKDWHKVEIHPGYSVADAKDENFDYHAPLDMTNVSVNYDNDFLAELEAGQSLPEVFVNNVRQAMKTGEPGMSFNFGPHANETLRNACTEVTSESDSDVCNLGSCNLSQIQNLDEMASVSALGASFLICGSLGAQLPYQKVADVREINRRIGLGYMGVHEWLLQRGGKYEMTPELGQWMGISNMYTRDAANGLCNDLGVSQPKAYRAIAPTGTISMMAGTTSGIEPVYAVAYRRRFLVGDKWHYTLHVDSTAAELIRTYGMRPDSIETSLDLAEDPERRVRFQADVQDYVDMAISSTINLPAWGSAVNNESQVTHFANIIAKYAPRLRGLTMYPDGARGGQPLTKVDYEEATRFGGQVLEEVNDICDITGGGVCGL